MKLSVSERKSTTVGEMKNLISVETKEFGDFFQWINEIWKAPLNLFFSIILLYRYLGVAALLGVAAMGLYIPAIILGSK